MKTAVRYLAVLLTVILFAALFTGCKQNQNPVSQPTSYVYTSQNSTETTNPDQTGSNSIHINNDWMKNYQVTFQYSSQGETQAMYTVSEKRSENYFSTEYLDGGDILYYTQGLTGVESYMIVPGQATQVHSVLEGKRLSDLSSTFMKLTKVSEDFPGLANVVFVCDEYIAGRAASKYIQRAYQDGQVTDTVYLWVDKEFGFASKCCAYNEQEVLTAYWEISFFSDGTLTDDNVKLDISKYTFADE